MLQLIPRFGMTNLTRGIPSHVPLLLRIQYAKLWKSLIMSDVEGIKSASSSMNAADSYALFAGMLTQRPWEKVLPALEGLREYGFHHPKP